MNSFFRQRLNSIGFAALLVACGVAAVALEFRYGYVETAIGRYLTWHNADRAEFGQVWENVTTSETVQQRLDALVQSRRDEESSDEPIDELSRLLELASTRERMILTRERFLDIYARLPYYQSSLIIEPIHLLNTISKLPQWQRTMVLTENGNLSIYLLDGMNTVLESIILTQEYVTFFLSERETRGYTLEAVSSLGPPYYPADVFFDAVVYLTSDEREGIPVTARELLTWRYKLQRVSVGRYALVGDRMEIAFELSGAEGIFTLRVLGRSLPVLQLAQRMDELFYRRYPESHIPPDSATLQVQPAESAEIPQ